MHFCNYLELEYELGLVTESYLNRLNLPPHSQICKVCNAEKDNIENTILLYWAV